MSKSRIMIQLEPETIEQVDKIRGAVPRAAWVRLLIEDRLHDPHQIIGSKCESCGETIPLRSNGDFGDWDGFCIRCYLKELEQVEKAQASVSQQEENRSPKPGDERSNRSRRAGKGLPDRRGLTGGDNDESPSLKPKACKHANQIRKLGRPYCTNCGEFV